MFVLVCACSILYVLVYFCIMYYCFVDSCSILIILDFVCPPYIFILCYFYIIAFEILGLKKGFTYLYIF